MKTIEEAMQLFFIASDDMPAAEANAATMFEKFQKRHSIIEEITASPVVSAFIEHYLETCGDTLQFNVKNLAVSMFVHGVLVGMEMEREELKEPCP